MYFLLLSHCGGEKINRKKQTTCKQESLKKKSKQLQRSNWDMSIKEEQGLPANTAACETHAAALVLVQ